MSVETLLALEMPLRQTTLQNFNSSEPSFSLYRGYRQDSADTCHLRISVKKVMILVAMGSIIYLPTTVAAFTTNPCLTGARAISGVVSTSAGVALIPLQTEVGVDILRWAVRALWAGTSACHIALLCAAVPRNKELYIFCTLLLAAHFVAGFAQTTDTAVEGIATFGPLVLPICAGLVYLPFRKRLLSNLSSSMATNNIRSEQQQPMDHEIATLNPNISPSASGPWRDDSGDMGVRLAVGLMGGNV